MKPSRLVLAVSLVLLSSCGEGALEQEASAESQGTGESGDALVARSCVGVSAAVKDGFAKEMQAAIDPSKPLGWNFGKRGAFQIQKNGGYDVGDRLRLAGFVELNRRGYLTQPPAGTIELALIGEANAGSPCTRRSRA